MARRSGGIKRSSWVTFRRRLFLVRQLLRAPASAEELITRVQTELGENGYPANAAAALKHDLDSLKGEYDCRIVYRRDQGKYMIVELGELALLDPPHQSLEALALLDASYPAGSGNPVHASVRTLLDQVILMLPQRAKSHLHMRRNAARQKKPAGRLDPNVLAAVRQAIEERHELVFRYWGLDDGEAPRRYRVAPYGIFFRSNGHTYLDATLLEVQPAGSEQLLTAVDYRLDRIVPGTVQILPNPLPPERPQARTFTLRYWLHPEIAQGEDGVSFFPNTRVEYNDDGSALVTATVSNLAVARDVLLRYGNRCRVIEPPELIALIRETLDSMASLYANPVAVR
ncbi:MAG: WYL domain-containing protein [Roseiflexus sp.]|nr:WYL domain-containing protein [Roseiflexus sp.]MCS7290501.1 WYL domain-containing protein [Roseiflexus sp.]MDW8148358.1 WYL domain-containing protein [Roseiflexaceae bacterium]MDW8232292.1 WYL domain-containing protein [Roseiflexaceae bacterium]